LPITVFRLPHLNKTPFDPMKDLTYVINLTGYTFGLVVRADAPWKDLAEFVAYAKANPEKITYGTPGSGSTPHLAVEQFAQKAGIKLSHIPFKGFSENMQSLLGGHTLALSDSTGWAQLVDAGRARLLATYGSKRTKRWPQVPTLLDAGYETISDSPFGFGGPKGMDPKVVKILHDAFKKALEDPNVQATLEKLDQPTIYMNSDDYAKFARKTFEEERLAMERLGMLAKN
jgi:tripartite-type tricarboxylate transporter receptor subunit TctC